VKRMSKSDIIMTVTIIALVMRVICNLLYGAFP
jgi:hypothetical protein